MRRTRSHGQMGEGHGGPSWASRVGSAAAHMGGHGAAPAAATSAAAAAASAAAAAEQERLVSEAKRLLRETRERERALKATLKERAFAHRIKWWERADPNSGHHPERADPR